MAGKGGPERTDQGKPEEKRASADVGENAGGRIGMASLRELFDDAVRREREQDERMDAERADSPRCYLEGCGRALNHIGIHRPRPCDGERPWINPAV